MSNTTNYNLKKFSADEKFSITAETDSLNNNMDIIDSTLKSITDDLIYETSEYSYGDISEGTVTTGDAYTSGNARWAKIGQVVVVNVYDLKINTCSTSSGTDNVIASGFPIPTNINDSIGMIFNFGTTYQTPVRIAVNLNGDLVLYWQTLSDTITRTGQFVYFTAE